MLSFLYGYTLKNVQEYNKLNANNLLRRIVMNRRDEANKAICELNTCVNLLISANETNSINNILGYMRCKIYDLYLINNLDTKPQSMTQPNENSLPTQPDRTFTSKELSGYNGKNGMPAYIAVNGIVYDVTNSAAWGAATHFGLSAGNDVTAQFASCHAGQPILQKLPQVGKMMNDRSESIQ